MSEKIIKNKERSCIYKVNERGGGSGEDKEVEEVESEEEKEEEVGGGEYHIASQWLIGPGLGAKDCQF